MSSGGFHPDYIERAGVRVYAVRLETAAALLDTTKKAIEEKLRKRRDMGMPELAQKGADGFLRLRVRDINQMIGLGEGLEWTGSSAPKKPKTRRPSNKVEKKEVVGGNVVPFRRK